MLIINLKGRKVNFEINGVEFSMDETIECILESEIIPNFNILQFV
jgi:hypothetical protein